MMLKSTFFHLLKTFFSMLAYKHESSIKNLINKIKVVVSVCACITWRNIFREETLTMLPLKAFLGNPNL